MAVEFDCDVVDGEARISASIAGTEEYDYFTCEDEETFYESVEFLDAREEVLGRLCSTIEEMMGDIRHAFKELHIERNEQHFM